MLKINPIIRDPLYLQVAAALRREILSTSAAGDLIEKEQVLARRFGVSVPTVREAMGVLVREGMVKRKRRAGTVVADPTGGREIGVLIELDISHPRTSYFFRRVAQETCRQIIRRGYRARLFAGHTVPGGEPALEISSIEIKESIARDRLLGVVCITDSVDTAWQSPLTDRDLPVIRLHDHARFSVDYDDLVLTGARQLLDQGRRRIAVIGHGKDVGEQTLSELRDLINRAGGQFEPQWICGDLRADGTGSGWEYLLHLWSAHNDRKPDGLIICDDGLFDDVTRGILALNIAVPEQLAVVTHANKGSGMEAPFPMLKWELDPDAAAVAMADGIVGALNRQARQPAPTRLCGQWTVCPSSFSEQVDAVRKSIAQTPR